MTKRLYTAVLICAIVALANHTASARDRAERQAAKRAELAQKVKTAIEGLGTGPDARVTVERRDAAKLAGYVAEAGPTAFVVRDATTGAATPVAYDDVTKVKGHNLATGWKIAIGAGVLFAVMLILVWTGAIGDAER